MGALRSLSCRAGCASHVSLLSVPRRGWLLSALGQQLRLHLKIITRKHLTSGSSTKTPVQRRIHRASANSGRQVDGVGKYDMSTQLYANKVMAALMPCLL